MNNLAELKNFGIAHAIAQGIKMADYRAVCGRIVSDADGEPGSWAAEWSREARRFEQDDLLLDATKRYSLARFPFPDGDARRVAQEKCIDTCDRWATDIAGLTAMEVEFAGGRLRCWACGLSAARPRPLLIVMGGIVTAKEQWVPLLPLLKRLGLAAVVTEMPGVGENTAAYRAESWQMLPAILDAVGDRADALRTCAMALSFSGHLALRFGARDHRLSGIVTAGAPVSGFFTDRDWQRRLPTTTTDTLSHLTGITAQRLPAELARWALTDDELSAVSIPVYYVCSRRDEIIPPSEAALLASRIRDLHLLSYDEGHAAPRYAAETRTWVLGSVLSMSRTRAPVRAMLAGAGAALRVRRRLTAMISAAGPLHDRVSPGPGGAVHQGRTESR
jgi:esterase FrsA